MKLTMVGAAICARQTVVVLVTASAKKASESTGVEGAEVAIYTCKTITKDVIVSFIPQI